ncbi:acyl-CoA oxidase [Flavobacterium sp. SE-s28]|uniref:acyl-CoA oxidase n=2 Tax=Flavobacterium silvaticum TaxID=1852020 RepID=A0A972JHC1_9FLAO|nr:acyl-CoA oxidase [Flavobacterium silvaticum]
MEKAFLPLLYLVWSDDLLSQKEVSILNTFFTENTILTDSEKKNLLSFIAVSNPPTRETLAFWKTEIFDELTQSPQIRSLFGLSLQLSGNDARFENLKPEFLELENQLGILGEEALLTFRSAANTQTSNLETLNSFDVKALQSILEGDTAGIEKQVRDLLQRPEFKYANTQETDSFREKVLDWCRILANEKLGSMAFPKEFGGGGNMKAYFAIMEALSYHDLSLVIKFGVQFGLWGMSVYFLGTEKHHIKYLSKIGTLELPGCFAMTETGHGSNVKGLETTATYDHKNQSFVINTPHPKAKKEYIGNAAVHGQMATVFAKLIIDGKDYGVNTFVVPLRDTSGNILDGIEIGDCGRKMGLNGVDNGTIRFHNVTIPKENMLDRFASVNNKGEFESPIPSDNRRFFTMLGTLVGGRIGIPKSALSAMKTGLTIAIKYSDNRRQFGPDGGSEVPILNYRIHQRRLFPHLANSYAFHFSLRYLTDRFMQRSEADAQEIEALAAGMKAYVTWNVRDSLQECREAMGGKGYLSENRIGDLKNDTEIYTTFEGDNTVLMQLVAKNRLAEFRKEFGKLDIGGMITYVFDSAKTALSEKNPYTSRRTDDEHLKDPEFHLAAFRYREKNLLSSAAMRIKKLVDGGMDAYDAFNVVQHHMIDVAKSYLERVILEQFLSKIETVSDASVRQQLVRQQQLFALNLLDKNKSWFLETGYFEPPKSKAIRKAINQLCWEIRTDAVALTNAFGIPDSLLGATVLTEK